MLFRSIKISCQRHIHFLEYGRTLAKIVTEAAASERPAEQDGDEGHGRKPAGAEELTQAVPEKQVANVVPVGRDGDDRYSDKDKAACGGEPAEDIKERFDPGTE